MEKEYKILGNYIRLVDERNRDLAVTKLLGVSISKKFIPSIANIVGTDLSNYKIVRTGQFAYGPVTSRNGENTDIFVPYQFVLMKKAAYALSRRTPQYLQRTLFPN